MVELGYSAVPEMQSRAISAMTLETRSPTPEEVAVGPTESEVREEMEKEAEEQITKLTEEHKEEVKKMEKDYE